MTNNKLKNLMNKWEAGRILTGRQERELFQELVNSGQAWELSTAYAKKAYALVLDGSVKA